MVDTNRICLHNMFRPAPDILRYKEIYKIQRFEVQELANY
jgi:hypothetical protein